MSTPPHMSEISPPAEARASSRALSGFHVRIGWRFVLVFLVLGLTLEALHGLKVGWYLDVSNETRRLMWRLAHAHGVLLGIVNVVFGLTVGLMPALLGNRARLASRCLTASAFLLPGGFFLGGVVVHDGDPFVGVLLVPVGALLLIFGVSLVARARGDVPS